MESFLTKLRGLVARIAPDAEVRARQDALAVQSACCSLMVEVAQLGRASAERKREAVARAMREQFGNPDRQLASMIEESGRPKNRLTSYYRPVALINKRFSAAEKTRLIEQFWRIAMADGEIDMYEDHLVRKLASLLYVAHTDFILAKHRVRGSGVLNQPMTAPH